VAVGLLHRGSALSFLLRISQHSAALPSFPDQAAFPDLHPYRFGGLSGDQYYQCDREADRATEQLL